MRTFIAWVVAVVVLGQSVRVDAQAPGLEAELEKTIGILTGKGFSGAVLVEQDGKVVLRKAYGFADQKAQIPNTPEMRFDLGSVTKPVIAAAVLLKVQSGDLTLDAKLGDLLKNVPKDKKGITLEQLLSHTGGIAKSYDFRKVDTAKRDAVTAAILKIKLANPPGTKHEYSNANYFLMAAILDAADKRGYEDTIRATIFQPLKMNTALFTSDSLPAGETSPGRYNNGVLNGPMVPWYHTWAHRGATGIACRVDDMSAFLKLLEPGSILDAQHRDNWLKVRAEDQALGWSILDQPGKPKVILHSGASPGAQALVAYYPESKTKVIVLSNAINTGRLDDWTILAVVREHLEKTMGKKQGD